MPEKSEDIVKELVIEYYADIYRYCFFRIRSQVICQDITQETFLRFFQRYDHYKKEKRLKQIMFRIAHNLCVDYYRKCSYRKEEELKETGSLIEKDKNISGSLVINKVIYQIPPHYRETLLLHYYYDFKIKEIALITGTSISNVKYRLKSGIKEMKELLEKEGITYEEWF